MSDKKQALKEHLGACRQQLLAALEGASDESWSVQVQSDGEQWTVLQMLRHLQDAHIGLSGQAQRLRVGEPTVPQDFDIDRWNARVQRKTAEAEVTPETCLETLQQSHEALLAFVDSIQDEDWAKTGWQPGLQKELDLETFVKVIGSHEAGHAAEIAEALRR